MTSFLRGVAVAAFLGAWILVLVGAGAGQSVHALGPSRVERTATAARLDSSCASAAMAWADPGWSGAAAGTPCWRSANDGMQK